MSDTPKCRNCAYPLDVPWEDDAGGQWECIPTAEIAALRARLADLEANLFRQGKAFLQAELRLASLASPETAAAIVGVALMWLDTPESELEYPHSLQNRILAVLQERAGVS